MREGKGRTMQSFLKLEEVMFSPALVQSVEKEYNTSCIITFENGRCIRVKESYPDVCRKIQEFFTRASRSVEGKEGQDHGD